MGAVKKCLFFLDFLELPVRVADLSRIGEGGSMVLDWRSADFSTRARSLAVLTISGVLASFPTACNNIASGSGCIAYVTGTVIEFESDTTAGFDDLSSPGAALGIAIDDGDPDAALIIALRFSGATVEQRYAPTCDTRAAIDSYDFAELNSITTPVADDNPFLTSGLTDTDGIEMMDHTMNALLFINDDDGLRVFLAVSGEIILRRTLGASSADRVTGDLTFVELTTASAAAEVLDGGDVLRIEDIDMDWDTVIQPTD